MLEVKNLVKVYKTKGGVEVRALDDVSVKFPEKGMVFLLGKSGSGKSTLLNVSGGLDAPDSGEVIVKGKSSKDFSGSDFDSYRNTFVGFIFQEYNILNEFTVEQNIALALQLQGKPNDKKAVNELLSQVDLEGLGKRKPNTLSGGQKQRVAIARALIKSPEIIMADEPTGALDSRTGKQVFDTLKKLSQDKLIIVVSHDREFAEQYGDRIIELKDGKIIKDESKSLAPSEKVSENVSIVGGTVSIKDSSKLTESDVKSIFNMLKSKKGETVITTGEKDVPEVKRVCKIHDNGEKEYFSDTKEINVKEYDGKQTKFIKSKLPASHAFKMGASGLKTKPIRLIFTILLSVVAFLLFGVVSTFMLYDSNYTVSEALKEANYPSVTVSKQYIVTSKNIKVDNETGEEKVDYEYENKYVTRFGEQEIADMNARSKLSYAGIFNFTNDRWQQDQSISMMLSNTAVNVKQDLVSYYPVLTVYGFTDCGADYMTRNGFTFIGEGRYPENKDEIALPEYLANLFVNTEGSGVTNASQLVGKKIKLNGCSAVDSAKEFTVVGVYNVGQIPVKYDDLKDANSTALSNTDKKKLVDSLSDYLNGSFNTIIYVHKDFYEEYKGNIRSNDAGVSINSKYVEGLRISTYDLSSEGVLDGGMGIYTEKTVADYNTAFKFYNLNDEKIDFKLEDNQVYVSKGFITSIKRSKIESYASDFRGGSLTKYAKDGNDTLGGDSRFMQELNQIYELQDLSYIEDTLLEWYPKLAERSLVYDTLASMYDDKKSTFLNDANALAAYNRIKDVIKMLEDERVYYDNFEADWDTLIPVFFDRVKGYENVKYGILASEIYYSNDYNEKLGKSWSEDMATLYDPSIHNNETYEVISWMKSDTNVSNENLDLVAKIKAYVDAHYEEATGKTIENAFDFTPDLSVEFSDVYYKDHLGRNGTLEVVGYFDCGNNYGAEYLITENFVKEHATMREFEEEYSWRYIEATDYVEPEDAKYNFVIALTDNSQDQIADVLTAGNATVHVITNSVYEQLSMFLETITELKQIFLIIGIVMGVFAALMLLNFISVSISAKRKDIGILRAVGARGLDVFKIFFAEAFIIAVICFVISTIGAYVVCGVINTSMVTIINMKLLNFQFVNVLLILGISFAISFIATFLPVYLAARKSPVDSIRAL